VKARIRGIWGRRDSMVGQQLEDLAASLRRFQPDLDFRVIEGAGHWTPYEALDAVNATLLDMFCDSRKQA
jgi:pimeloyl-ACP methyl ester carboxylesterase